MLGRWLIHKHCSCNKDHHSVPGYVGTRALRRIRGQMQPNYTTYMKRWSNLELLKIGSQGHVVFRQQRRGIRELLSLDLTTRTSTTTRFNRVRGNYRSRFRFHSNVAFIAVNQQREKKFHKLNLLQTKIPYKT